MASILNPNQEDNNEENQQNGPQQVSSGEAATVGGGMSAGPGTKSGRFTNISNYLKANQGYNQQGGGLAGKIAGNIKEQGNQASQNINKAKSEFEQNAQANRTQFDSGLVNNALNNATDFAQNDQNVTNFQKQLNAKYSGPEALQNANLLQNQAQNVQNLTAQTASEGGRYNLLRNMFNKPTYSTGQQKLDNLLLQGNRNQLKSLTGTRTIGNQVNNAANAATNDAIAKAQQFKDEAAQTAQQTNEQYNQVVSEKQAQLEQQKAQAEADRKALQERLSGGLSARELAAEDLTKLGLQEGAETYGVNLADYFTANSAPATIQNTATQDQALNMNALAKLAGKVAQFDPTAAGSFANSQYNFDKTALDSALGQRKATYERQDADAVNLQQQAWGALGGSQGQLDQAARYKQFRDSGMDPGEAAMASGYFGNGGEDEAERDLQHYNQFNAANAQREALKQMYGIGNVIKRKQ
jgi:hypothetical protein